MKKRLQGLIAGVLIGVTITSGMVLAKSGTEVIEALYNNIKIYVDGVKIEAKDATGKTVEAFIYDGTTYLPVRAVGEAIGKTVTWDGETQSVYLGNKPGDSIYLMNNCPPYNVFEGDIYTFSSGKSFKMSGKKYYDGVRLGYSDYALFNLNSEYKILECEVGNWDDWIQSQETRTISFWVDDKLVKRVELESDDLPQNITVPLNHGTKLKILADDNNSSYCVGIANLIVK